MGFLSGRGWTAYRLRNKFMRGLTLVVSVECSLILEANLIINKGNCIGIRIALRYYSKKTRKLNKMKFFLL